MPFVETRLIAPTTLTTSASSALYTVPTGYSAIIKQLVVTNTTGSAATFTFYIGAASAGNALFSGTSVAANDTVIINLSQVLTTGEVLRALASTGSALNLTVSGVLNDGPLASTATYIADNAITSAKIADGAIVNADINASAAIDKTKISGTAVTVADTGTVTSTMILDGTILNADINASAAIDQSKINAPTAAAGTNTTQIATTEFANAAGGLVYITSATAPGTSTVLNMDNIFSSTYDNYHIILQNFSPVTAGVFFDMRYRAAGSPRVTQYQFACRGLGAGGSSADDSSGGYVAQGYFGGQSTFAGDTVSSSWEVFTPFTVSRTGLTFQTVSYPGVFAVRSGMIEHDSSVSNDGIVIFSSVNFSGKVTVYGYRKA